MDALYQKPKKQRRHEQNGIEKIEEEPEVRGGRGRVEDNGDRHKAQCGNPMTTGTSKAPEGTPAAAAEATTRQQRLAPLAEQVEGAKLIVPGRSRGNFLLNSTPFDRSPIRNSAHA